MTAPELRPLTAGRLLTIRRETRAPAADEAERAALCNAQVLSECCFGPEGRCFPDGQAVLDALTFPEMEALLERLAGREETAPAACNPRFDEARFAALREGRR